MVELTKVAELNTERAARKKILFKFIFEVLGHPVAGLSQHPELSSSGQPILPRSHAPAGQLVKGSSNKENHELDK